LVYLYSYEGNGGDYVGGVSGAIFELSWGVYLLSNRNQMSLIFKS